MAKTKVAYYNHIEKRWSQNFKSERRAIRDGFRFNSLYLFCISEHGSTVQRVYKIPEKEIELRKGISIYKNPTIGRYSTPFIPWYEEYRVKDIETINRVNEIWKKLMITDARELC